MLLPACRERSRTLPAGPRGTCWYPSPKHLLLLEIPQRVRLNAGFIYADGSQPPAAPQGQVWWSSSPWLRRRRNVRFITSTSSTVFITRSHECSLAVVHGLLSAGTGTQPSPGPPGKSCLYHCLDQHSRNHHCLIVLKTQPRCSATSRCTWHC